MLPWPILLLACPHCEAWHNMSTISSGNTFGAKHWTDGKFEAPMLPSPPAITRCGKCEKFFWPNEARKIGGETSGADPSPQEYLIRGEYWIRELDEDGYASALSEQIAETGEGSPKASILSVLYWHKINDPVRETGEMSTKTHARLLSHFGTFVRNLEDLAESVLMRAEYLRELGRFEECLAIIDDGNFGQASWAANEIARLAREGKREVAVMGRQSAYPLPFNSARTRLHSGKCRSISA